MEHVATGDTRTWIAPAAEKRPLGRALDAEHLAVNYYELAPGDAFGFGYHRHPDQEEVFYVLRGTATFETEDGDIEVGADEAVRFAPGEWQLGRNDGDQRVVALAMGAPATENETDLRRACPDCEADRTPHRIEQREEGAALVTVCSECEAETGRFR